MNNEGIHMDAEVRAELEQIEGRLELALQRTIDKAIRAGIKEIKESIAELFNKDIQHINEHLIRHDKYHEEHFKDIRKLWKSVDDIKAEIPMSIDKKQQPVIEALDEIKEQLVEIKTSRDTAKEIDEKQDRKTELTAGKVAALCGVIALIFTIIGYFINMGT